MDVRLGRASVLAGSLALLLILLFAAPAGAQQQPRISQSKATEIARLDPKAVARLFKMTKSLARVKSFQPMYQALVVDDMLDVATTDRIHDGEIPARRER